MAEHRRDRVAQQLHHELAQLLLREVADPSLAGVTITAVQLTADLAIARVYYRTLAAAPSPQEVARALRRATPFLRGRLGRTLGLRSTPELRFAFDTLPDVARRVETLLDEAQRTPVAPAPRDEAGRDDGERDEAGRDDEERR